MKKYIFAKVAVIVIAILEVFMMTACGSDDNDNIISENKALTSEELSEEDAIAIANDGFRVIKEMNAEQMIQYTNIELLYYMGRGQEVDSETMFAEITALVNEWDEDYNNLGIVGHYAVIENIKLYNAELISTEELNELNAMLSNDDLAIFKGIPDDQYNIENAYKLQMSYDGIEKGQESYVLLVYVNNQWELDICLAIMRDTYYMTMQMN